MYELCCVSSAEKELKKTRQGKQNGMSDGKLNS
jgi:hypothetical protein